MKPVEEWSGAEVRLLRQARRMSVREFAKHLGVTDRMVSKWEAAGVAIRPRPINQEALDQSLLTCTPFERHRFDQAVDETPGESRAPRSRIHWSLIVDLPPENPELAAEIAAAVRAAVLAHEMGVSRAAL
jgi:transcriptional regulator with XRE-family HTH domain